MCLLAIGLHPLPKKGVDLQVVMGATVTARIEAVAAEFPDVRGPRALGQCVFERLRSEFAVPTEALQAQLRYWICHHVTHHCVAGRGGVQGEADISTASVPRIDTVNGDFRPGDWLVVPPPSQAATSSATSIHDNHNGLFDFDPSVLTTERLQLMRDLVALRERAAAADIDTIQARTDGEVAVIKARTGGEVSVIQARTAEKQIDLELLKLRTTGKRGASSSIAGDGHPKRARRTAEIAVTRGVRVSLSHHVWRLVAPSGDDMVPVFRAVHDWCRGARLRPAVVSVVHLPVGAGAEPVVYMFPEGHGRHPGPRRVEACVRHVRAALGGAEGAAAADGSPAETTPAGLSSASTAGSTGVDPVAVRTFVNRFRAPSAPSARDGAEAAVPPELAPIGVQQQLADTQCLCAALGLTLACWPTLPDEAAGAWLPPTAAADWRRRSRPTGPLPSCHRVSDFTTVMRWDPRHVNHYHLACLAGTLDDRHRGGYPAGALWVFRRVMVVCREIGDFPHLAARIAETFRRKP
jgi:hypothetical protein